MDALKETLDAWLARIKSPVLGYIVLAFVLVNWKPLWFLVFADQGVMAKFAFFDAQTDGWSLYFWPVFIGGIIALASPYINWGAGVLVSKAVTGHRLMQLEEQKKLAKSRRELAAALKETAIEETLASSALIEAGKNKRTAFEMEKIEGISGSQGLSSMGDIDSPSRPSMLQLKARFLKPFESKLLFLIVDNDAHVNVASFDQPGSNFATEVADKYFSGDKKRALVEISETLASLNRQGLIELGQDKNYSATGLGLDIFKIIKQQSDQAAPTNHNPPPHQPPR